MDGGLSHRVVLVTCTLYSAFVQAVSQDVLGNNMFRACGTVLVASYNNVPGAHGNDSLVGTSKLIVAYDWG